MSAPRLAPCSNGAATPSRPGGHVSGKKGQSADEAIPGSSSPARHHRGPPRPPPRAIPATNSAAAVRARAPRPADELGQGLARPTISPPAATAPVIPAAPARLICYSVALRRTRRQRQRDQRGWATARATARPALADQRLYPGAARLVTPAAGAPRPAAQQLPPGYRHRGSRPPPAHTHHCKTPRPPC